jgi:hypothetical protein
LGVPGKKAHSVPNFEYSNVIILKIPFRGQVRQRTFGFTITIGDYILQFDNYLIIESDYVEIMLKNLNTKVPELLKTF